MVESSKFGISEFKSRNNIAFNSFSEKYKSAIKRIKIDFEEIYLKYE